MTGSDLEARATEFLDSLRGTCGPGDAMRERVLAEATALVDEAEQCERFDLASQLALEARRLEDVRTGREAAAQWVDRAVALALRADGGTEGHWSIAPLIVLTRMRSWPERHSDAPSLGRRVVALAERIHGDDSLEVVRALDACSSTFDDTPEGYAEQQRLRARAVALVEQQGEAFEHLLPKYLDGLALATWSLRKLDEAERIQARSNEIFERHNPPDDFMLPHKLSVRADILIDPERFEEAVPLLERAIALVLAGEDPYPPEVAHERLRLGVALRGSSRAMEALPVFEQGCADLAGTASPILALLLIERARTLVALGRVDEARPLGDEAIATVIARHGADHELVSEWRQSIAELFDTAKGSGEAC